MSPDNHHPRKRKARKGTTNAKEFRFVNYSLSQKDKEWLAAADLDAEFPLSSFGDLVTAGYKLGFSLDDKNNTYVASITDRSEGSAFYNACLTGRGATPLDAWFSVCYRHLVVAQGDWAVFHQAGDNEPSRFE